MIIRVVILFWRLLSNPYVMHEFEIVTRSSTMFVVFYTCAHAHVRMRLDLWPPPPPEACDSDAINEWWNCTHSLYFQSARTCLLYLMMNGEKWSTFPPPGFTTSGYVSPNNVVEVCERNHSILRDNIECLQQKTTSFKFHHAACISLCKKIFFFSQWSTHSASLVDHCNTWQNFQMNIGDNFLHIDSTDIGRHPFMPWIKRNKTFCNTTAPSRPTSTRVGKKRTLPHLFEGAKNALVKGLVGTTFVVLAESRQKLLFSKCKADWCDDIECVKWSQALRIWVESCWRKCTDWMIMRTKSTFLWRQRDALSEVRQWKTWILAAILPRVWMFRKKERKLLDYSNRRN